MSSTEARERFLIVRLAAVGDVVMASTLARRIRDERPNAHITWLCGATVAPLVRQFADVDEVLTMNERALLRGGALRRLAELAGTWKQLIRRRFTRVMLLHADWRYRAVTLPLLRVPTTALSGRHAFGRLNPISGRYFGNEYARLLDGLESIGPITSHHPLGRIKGLGGARRRPPMADNRARVVIVPGGARNVMRESGVRRWPIEHYVKLARGLIDDGAQVILIGDASDAWVRASFTGLDVDDQIGRTTLPETLFLLSESDLVVSHDTGPMHLARLVGARLLALFGPTMPSQFILPDDRTTVLWGGDDLPCRPCYDGREFARCHQNLCMMTLDPQVVLATARTMLRQQASSTGPQLAWSEWPGAGAK